MKKKGISLIVLIIKIIVVIILAAAVILTISKNNPIESAKEARFKEDVRTFQDELSLYISRQYANAGGHWDRSITAKSYDEIVNYIPSFTKKYEGKFIINNNNLEYTNKLDEKEKEYAQSLNVKERRVLPKEYQQVEYIESTGTQYIDTKIEPDEKYGFFVDVYFDVDINTFSPSVKVLGSSKRNGGNWGGIEIGSYASTNGGQFTWFSNSGKWINPKLVSKKRMSCYCINDVYGTSNDDKTELVSKTNFNNLCGNIYLFGIHSEKGVYTNTTSYLKIFEYKCYSNLNIIQNFIPCYSTTSVVDVDGKECPSGTIGMYDTVEGKFYTNQGTGEFIAGPEV